MYNHHHYYYYVICYHLLLILKTINTANKLIIIKIVCLLKTDHLHW